MGSLSAEVCAVISNKKDAYGLERARLAGIPALVKPKHKEQTREAYDAELAELVEEYPPGLGDSGRLDAHFDHGIYRAIPATHH